MWNSTLWYTKTPLNIEECTRTIGLLIYLNNQIFDILFLLAHNLITKLKPGKTMNILIYMENKCVKNFNMRKAFFTGILKRMMVHISNEHCKKTLIGN